MDGDRMFELAQALAAAKGRQDVARATKLLHPEMVLETPAFGTIARGLAENETVLRRFFASFPDYDVLCMATPAMPTPWCAGAPFV